MRSLARESVFKYLFSRLFNPDDEGLFDVLTKELNSDDKKFASDLLNFVLSNEEKYLNAVASLSKGYKLDRVYNTDKVALLIGMAELENCKETPRPVVIDEAVNLSAKYSAENGTDFVNGILVEFLKRNSL